MSKRQSRATIADKNAFIVAAAKEFGSTITRAQVLLLCEDNDLAIPTWLMGGKFPAGRGLYAVPAPFEGGSAAPASKPKKVSKKVSKKWLTICY